MREMKDYELATKEPLPIGWEYVRNKALFTEVNDRCDASTSLPLLSVSEYYGVAPRSEKVKETDILVRADSLDGYKICKPDDIVMNIMLAWKGAQGVSEYDGIVSPAYCVYRKKPGVPLNMRYVHYLIRTSEYNSLYKRFSTGIIDSRLRLYPDRFLSLFCHVPPIKVQDGIVAKLDEVSKTIDALIANQQAQIEKLKQYKQSLITKVVTKGLDPNATMKDSEVEWIGEIASCFQLMRLKDVAIILDQYRKPITADQRNQNAEVLFDYYGASGAIDKIDGYTIDDHVMLIGEDGANLRMRNLPLMYEVVGKAWINNHAHILKPKEGIDFYYLFYALEGLDINPYITGSAQPKLNQENLKNIFIPIPTINEQIKISAYIKEKHDRIDCVIEIKRRKIELLIIYKQSLVFEYVTGKKEVSASNG